MADHSAVFGVMAAAMLAAAAFSLSATAAAPLERIELDTVSGAHVFQVEVMRTDAERERGLMFVRSMPADRGMLFDFPSGAQPVQFWMKDTYIPLDMVFIDTAGHVVSIKRDAKPMDETVIDSGGATKGVLEVNAGQADAIGLKVGDVVKHPIFEAR